MARPRALRVLALLSIPAVSSAIYVRSAAACGGLYIEHDKPYYEPPKPQNVPSVKEVPFEPKNDPSLVVFDEDRGVEHLVRDIRFDRAAKNVAILVPVPAKAKVHGVERSPFEALAAVAPFGSENAPQKKIDSVAKKPAADLGDVAVEKIGSFTVTMLPASDTAKVDAWLKENGANDTNGLREWMAHYSALGFHYAAFHYSSPGDEWSTGVTTETVRLTFETNVPYLPYREVRDDLASYGDERRGDLWVIAKSAHRPVGSRTAWSGDVKLAEPFLDGGVHRVDSSTLASLLADLAPSLDSRGLVVQTFRDKKSDRRGFGDVLLVPQEGGEHVALGPRRFVGDPFPPAAKSIDSEWATAHTRHLAILDPRLEVASKPTIPPKSEPVAAGTDDSKPPWRVVGASAGAILALIFSAAVRRRRMRIGALGCASLFVIGCAATLGDNHALPTAATPAIDRYDDRERALFAVLDGHHDDIGVDAAEPFSRASYRMAIRAQFQAVRLCYQSVFGRDRGTVEMLVRVNTDGSVAAANLVGGTLESAAVATCVTKQVEQASFPKADEPVTLRYAVDLGVETIYTPGYMVRGGRKMPLGFQAY